MIYIKLLLAFFKIGLFSFGGGYAMIPLIQKDIEANAWMKAAEFVDIIAIAEMTPGPIAVNAATFVGYKTAGVPGGIVATLGVTLPSLLLILAVSGFFFKYRTHPANGMLFYGIRPVITGLIATAAIFVAEAAVLTTELSFEAIKLFFRQPLEVIDLKGLLLLAAALAALVRFRLHPILLIGGAAAAGIVLFGLVP